MYSVKMLHIILVIFSFIFVRRVVSLKYLNSTDLIRAEGYNCEVHEVETEDGYILEIHRIPGNSKSYIKERKPILIGHGMLFSSTMYVLNGPKNSFAFYLADMGYDVWLFNNRGNSISVKHKTLDRKKNPKEFYDYSFHEIGVYDLPPVIDYILKKTNNKQLTYIGYSQGGTSFYIMASTKPEYNKKISLAILVAPSSIMRNTWNMWMNFLSRIGNQLEDFGKSMNLYVLPGMGYYRRFFLQNSGDGFIRNLITLPLHASLLQSQHVDETLLPKMYYYAPTVTSLRQIFHYGQLIKSGKFRQYDFRKEENLKRYNSEEPPFYDFKNVTTPIVIFYSDSDAHVTEKDVEIVSNLLPNVIHKQKIEGYDHADFFNGVDQVEDFYVHLVKFLEK